MATIARIPRKGGVAFKAIVRDRTGRPFKSNTSNRKTDARAWAKRIEGDQEKIAALGAPGAGNRVKQLVCEYQEQWSAKDKSTLPRVRWWGDQLGNLMLTDVTRAEIRDALDRCAAGHAPRSAACSRFISCSTGSTCPILRWKKHCTICEPCGASWVSTWAGPAPDETTVCKFRHLLEA